MFFSLIISALFLLDIALLLIYVIKKNKVALYACIIIFVILIVIVLSQIVTSKSQLAVETTGDVTISASQDSLALYYETKDQNLSNIENNGVVKGLKKIVNVTVPCVKSPKGVTLPCGFDVDIFSKEALHAGKQDFYFAIEGGVANSYHGPFNDDLLKLISGN